MARIKSPITSKSAKLIWILLFSLSFFGCTAEQPQPIVATDTSSAKDLPEAEETQETVVFRPEGLTGHFKELLDVDGVPFELDIYQGADGYVPQLTTGLFADLNGDNIPEIIISTVEHDVYEVSLTAETGHLIYLYAPKSEALKLYQEINLPKGRIIIAEDLDGDGAVDLVFGSSTPNEVISWGSANGQFNKAAPIVPEQLLPGLDGTPNPEYPGNFGNDHVLDDVDSDGWLDIISSGYCDRGQARPFLRTGLREYTYDQDVFDFLPNGSVWSLHMVRLAGGEHLLMMPGEDGKSCDNHHVFFLKTEGRTPKGHPMFVEFDPLPEEMDAPPTQIFGPRMSSPMGVAVGDLNGDGFLDWAVSQDPHTSVLAGAEDWPMTEESQNSGVFMVDSDGPKAMLAWGLAFLDLDLDGRVDIITVHGDDDPRFLLESQYVGPQYTTAHWNAGDFHFKDMTPDLGLDKRGNWRALSVGDLDGDARPDLLVGGFGEKPQILLNRLQTNNYHLAITLKGRTSNHLGIGAHVRVQAEENGPYQTFYMGSVGSPIALSKAEIYVGLGSASKAHFVEITWPSGVVQELHNLESGKSHRIEEPELMQIEPNSRHIKGDGDEKATIRIQPELLSKDSLSSDEVLIEQVYGDANFTGPVTEENGVWERSMTCTEGGTSSVIEITIGEQKLYVRPRIWCDKVEEGP